MTDREMLELAAKAAGKTIDQKTFGEYQDAHRGMVVADGEHWNPLNDDGDALRLAVKLGLCIGPNLDGDLVVCFGSDGNNITEPLATDANTATRRAIVRAAAEIGRAMG